MPEINEIEKELKAIHKEVAQMREILTELRSITEESLENQEVLHNQVKNIIAETAAKTPQNVQK